MIFFQFYIYQSNKYKTINLKQVRECNEYVLEEDLYAKLLFLYRSPETMIKWTRRTEHNDIDEDNLSLLMYGDDEMKIRKSLNKLK